MRPVLQCHSHISRCMCHHNMDSMHRFTVLIRRLRKEAGPLHCTYAAMVKGCMGPIPTFPMQCSMQPLQQHALEQQVLEEGLTIQEGMAQPYSNVEQGPGERNHSNPQPA